MVPELAGTRMITNQDFQSIDEQMDKHKKHCQIISWRKVMQKHFPRCSGSPSCLNISWHLLILPPSQRKVKRVHNAFHALLAFSELQGTPAQLWMQNISRAELSALLRLGATTAQGGQASKRHVCALFLGA